MRKPQRITTGKGGRPNKNVRHSRKSNEIPETLEENLDQQETVDDSETKDSGKIIEDIREAIRLALIDSTKDLQGWLRDVGKDNPARALTIYKELTEFIVPKIQRTDGSKDKVTPIQIVYESIDNYKLRKAEDKRAKIAEEVARTNQIPKDEFL